MADEGYIRKLTATIQEQAKEFQEQTRKDNRDAEIIKSEAPKVWIQLKTWVKGAVAQVNSETLLYLEGSDLNSFTLRYTVGREMREVKVIFFSIIGQIAVSGSLFDARFDSKVEGNRLHFIEDMAPNGRVSIDDMGKQILDAAVNQ
jgi:hypothetical protein